MEAPAVSIPHEVARYRLSLLDAAQSLDAMANDMDARNVADFPARCRELARQMREFAGHTVDGAGSNQEFQGGKTAATGTALMRMLRKARPW